jgi:hypothetical protein
MRMSYEVRASFIVDSRMPSSLRAYEYLVVAIATASSRAELTRFRQLAQAHYTGARRRLLLESIAARDNALIEHPFKQPVPLPSAVQNAESTTETVVAESLTA